MKKFSIFTIIIALILTISVTIVGCGESSSGSGSGSKSGTYNITVWAAEADMEMIESMLYEYEQQNKGNKYNWKVQPVGENNAGTKVIADPSTAADVFSFASDQLGKLVANNSIYQVPSEYDEQIESQIVFAQNAAMYDGINYAYPYTYENCFLYYNKSMLNETQIKSVESILSANTSAEANLGIDMDDSYYTTIFLFTAGMELYGRDGTNATSIDLANDNAIAGCDYILSLASKGKFKSISEADQSSALKNKKIAAVISGPHMIDEFKTALGKDYAVAKLPTIKLGTKNTQMISFSGVKMYGVNRNTQYPEECAKLAAFLSNADNQALRLDEREFCPTDQDLYAEAAGSGIKGVQVVIDQARYTKLKPAYTSMAKYWTPMGSFLGGVFKKTKAKSSWTTELRAVEDSMKE